MYNAITRGASVAIRTGNEYTDYMLKVFINWMFYCLAIGAIMLAC